VAEDYEYRGLIAEAWDLLRGDTSNWGDRALWRALLVERGGASLDVGCGTGRLLLDFLADGFDVDGVDNSPEMLALCREKAAALGIDLTGRLFLQEMDALDLPRAYTTIFVPSMSFQLLTDPAVAARALIRFREQLAPGGLLAASLGNKFWLGRTIPPQGEWVEWAVLAEAERADGATVRRWIRNRYDHTRKTFDEENRYEVLRDGVVERSEFHERAPALRWYDLAEALALFEQAGFRDVRATSNDSSEPATAADSRFKVFGTRP